MSYHKIQFTNQIRKNIALYLNKEMLDRGFYRNISLGELNSQSNDLSRFSLDYTDSSYPSGVVWKAPRENWVYEGGISLPSRGDYSLYKSVGGLD